ncbi:MAG: hypothetical protein KF715_06740 [Candidatus Didemnitutus sp.]|nr:hypothetical protein [Candidatus Didemnitutus sp.]
MELLFIHLILLVWLAVAAAYRWTETTSETLLGAGALAWVNLVGTALTLSCFHRWGNVGLTLGVSLTLGAATALLAWRFPSTNRRHFAPATTHPVVYFGTLVAVGLLIAGSIALAATYAPLDPNALGRTLPRALQFLVDGNVFAGTSGQPSQPCLFPDYGILHSWLLTFRPELTTLNFVNLILWLFSGCALHRFCRLAGCSREASLLALGCAWSAFPVLTQAVTLDHHLAAGVALLAAAAFLLAWSRDGRNSSALFGGALAGLAAGSSLAAAMIVLCLAGLATLRPFRVHLRRGWKLVLPGLALGLLPTLLSLIAAARHDSLVHIVAETIAAESATLDAVPARELVGPWADRAIGPGLTGCLCLGAALLGFRRSREWSQPAFWLGAVGLAWAVILALPALATRHSPQLAPAILLAAPSLAIALDRWGAPRNRWLPLALPLLAICLWSGSDTLRHNIWRPLEPLLNPSAPRLEPAKLRAELEQHLVHDARLNLSPPAVPHIRTGSVPRYDLLRTDAYNILSRPRSARSRALAHLDLGPAYVLLTFPGKATPGVEPLGSTSSEFAARDYFGLPGNADEQVFDNNGLLLATVERSRDTNPPQLLIDIAGLHQRDGACVDVIAETESGVDRLLATFSRAGTQTAPYPSSVRALRFRLRNSDPDGAERSTAVLEALPPDQYIAATSTDPRLSFQYEFVSRPEPTATKAGRGLLPTEGPFPDLALPLLRWMRADRIQLQIPAAPDVKTLRVSLSAHLHQRRQGLLEISCNGRAAQRIEFTDPESWQDAILEFPADSGGNVIELHELPPKPGPDWYEYLNRYPDVRRHVEMMRKPLVEGAREHYETCGKAEGRTVVLVEQPRPAADAYLYMFRSLRVEGLKP